MFQNYSGQFFRILYIDNQIFCKQKHFYFFFPSMYNCCFLGLPVQCWKQCWERTFFFFFFFNLKIIYLFIYWLHWVFVAACGLSLIVASGDYSSLWCAGFSLWWLLLLQSVCSRCTGFSSCGLWALERRLSSCGTRAYLLHGMWDLPGPEIEPVSPALAGRFLSPVPPEKPQERTFLPCSWS